MFYVTQNQFVSVHISIHLLRLYWGLYIASFHLITWGSYTKRQRPAGANCCPCWGLVPPRIGNLKLRSTPPNQGWNALVRFNPPPCLEVGIPSASTKSSNHFTAFISEGCFFLNVHLLPTPQNFSFPYKMRRHWWSFLDFWFQIFVSFSLCIWCGDGVRRCCILSNTSASHLSTGQCSAPQASAPNLKFQLLTLYFSFIWSDLVERAIPGSSLFLHSLYMETLHLCILTMKTTVMLTSSVVLRQRPRTQGTVMRSEWDNT